jgi:hypothetical protein
MTNSLATLLDDLGASPASAGLPNLTTAREATNGAPCLGLAMLAAGTLWAGLGYTMAFLFA